MNENQQRRQKHGDRPTAEAVAKLFDDEAPAATSGEAPDLQQVVAARALLEANWDAEGACASCGWHAALGEYYVDAKVPTDVPDWRDALRWSKANTDYHGLVAFTPGQLEHFVSMLIGGYLPKQASLAAPVEQAQGAGVVPEAVQVGGALVAKGAQFTDEEICKIRAAKRGMVDALIESNMNYGKCGVVSHHLEKLIAGLATPTTQEGGDK